MADANEWLGKAAAAKLLGVNTRTLERHEAKGYIEKRYQDGGPLSRLRTVEYLRADILALKAGKPNVHPRPDVARPRPEQNRQNSQNSQNGQIGQIGDSAALALRSDDPFAALAAHLAALAAAFPTPAPAVKPWLTPEEAAGYSGLPASWLVAQARLGAIRAVNVGTGAREFWRFSREALEK